MGIIKHSNLDKTILIIFGTLLSLSIVAFLVLTNTHVSAETTTLSDSKSATASVNVNAACTMSSGSNSDSGNGNTYTGTISPGTISEFGPSTIKAICNDNGGYAIYAIGYSGNSYVPTTAGLNTDLILSSNSNSNIHTGTTTSGDTSSWSMKLSTDSTQTHVPIIAGSTSDPERQTGDIDYSIYSSVPSTYTKVAYYPNSTMNPSDPTTKDTGSYLNANYRVYVSPTQQPGTYNGAVRYTLVHPNMSDDSNAPNLNLYDTVAAMSKGKQSPDDLRQVITADNSGVYEYDPATYGVASDANNNYPIYYYRGIIDSSFAESDQYGGIGSSGDGKLYPNYVRLGNDTCWRIVRTTGSGGVKMIYNGVWNGANSTCANGRASANAISGVYFNRGNPSVDGSDYYGTLGFAVYVGYNYNDVYAYNNTQYTSPVEVSLLFSNVIPSNARIRIESWYSNKMNDYTGILEENAGFCNDRSVYINNLIVNKMTPYETDGPEYFGPHIRNMTPEVGHTLSLMCPNVEDNLSVADGLSYPLALITADEASLSGDGCGSNNNPSEATLTSSNFSHNAYLRSGANYWLLSPGYRTAGGAIFGYRMSNDGHSASYYGVQSGTGVRPAISLVHNTTIVSGSGTATDPWTIAE